MSAQWMLYALAVGLLNIVAALAAEQGTRLARRPGRWVWALALALTVALPLLVLGGQGASPDASAAPARPVNSAPAPVSTLGAALAPTFSLGGLPATPSLRLPARLTSSVSVSADHLARLSWQISSALTLAALLIGGLALHRRQRGWQRGSFGGAAVLVSVDAGPAVVGILRPRIVIPQWLMNAAAARQAVVLAHEQSHIDAGDQRLLACAWLLLAAMPWNLPLWFMVRRLRRAIEVDCDARVLARGVPLPEYGAALIAIGAQPSAAPGRMPFAAPAMAETPGFLEQRMRLMMRKSARWHKLVAPFLLLLSLDIGVATARMAPPPLSSAPVQGELQADRAALAGYYQVGPNRVAVVSVSNEGLTMKTNLEPGWRLLAESADHYFLPGSELRVHFDRAAGTVTVSRMGVDGAAGRRTDAGAVQRADAYVGARIASGRPLAGGQDIVQRNINARDLGALHAADFSPALLRQAGALLPRLRQRVDSYGNAQEITFAGVNRWGWDTYKVRYVNGSQSRVVTWSIWLDDDGKLAEATADLGQL